jgi:hypothetical protein
VKCKGGDGRGSKGVKQLKTHAQQLATDYGVPLKKLLAFIEGTISNAQ